MTAALALSMTALLFAISGFVLGLLAFIQVRANMASTHTVQMQEAPAQQDLSEHFGSMVPDEEGYSIPNDELEAHLLGALK